MADRKMYVDGADGTDNAILTPVGLVDLGNGTWAIAIGQSSSAVQTAKNLQVGGDLTRTWANSAAAGTAATGADITLPTVFSANGETIVSIYNPSLVTALTVVFYNKQTALGGGDRYSEITRVSVPINTAKDFVLKGWLFGNAAAVSAVNDTALGGADGFSATIRIRQM